MLDSFLTLLDTTYPTLIILYFLIGFCVIKANIEAIKENYHIGDVYIITSLILLFWFFILFYMTFLTPKAP